MSMEVNGRNAITPGLGVTGQLRSGESSDVEVFDFRGVDLAEADRNRGNKAASGDEITEFIKTNEQKYKNGVYDENKLSNAFNFEADITNMESMITANTNTLNFLNSKISSLEKSKPAKGTDDYKLLQDYKSSKKELESEKNKLNKLNKDALKAKNNIFKKLGVQKVDTFSNKDINTKSSEDVSNLLKNSSRLNVKDQETYLKKLGFDIDDKNLEVVDKNTPQPYFRDKKTGMMYGVSAADDGSVNLSVTSKDGKKTSIYKLTKEKGDRYGSVDEDGKRQLTNSQKKAIISAIKSGNTDILAKGNDILNTVNDEQQKEILYELHGINKPDANNKSEVPSTFKPKSVDVASEVKEIPDVSNLGSTSTVEERKERYINNFKKAHPKLNASKEKIDEWALKTANQQEQLAQKINSVLTGQQFEINKDEAVMSENDYVEMYIAEGRNEAQAKRLAQLSMDIIKKRMDALNDPKTDIHTWSERNKIDLKLYQ